MQADLIALSRADVQRDWQGPTLVNGAPAPTTGDYQNVADYAQLLYTDGLGELVYITLPAPRSTIFKADQETVDPVAIATLTTAVIGTIITGSGNAVTAYVGGVRRRSGREYQ